MAARIVVFLILILALHGCATRPAYVPPPVTGIVLNDICTKYNVAWSWDGVTQVVILSYKDNKAKALVGSNVILVGKEKIILSKALVRQNSTIYVPEDFESKVLAPFGIITGGEQPKIGWGNLKIRTVVIDAGHGGKDPGCQGHAGVKEKNVVFDVAQRVKGMLEEAGVKVIMTRNADTFISLPQRTEIATKSDADIFVSIHANSNPTKKTQGIEVYYVKTSNHRDLEEDQRTQNEKTFAKRLSIKYSKQLRVIIADMMYAYKTAESQKLAERIVRDGSVYVDTPNRGARTCRFFVVRNTLVPAVLIEVGYLTNRQEEGRLNTTAYRQRLAETISQSILKYASDS